MTQKMVYSLIDAMNEMFQEGDTVSIPDFGTFEVKKRMEKVMVSPTTQKRMLIPPKLVLAFKASQSVRQMMKGGRDNG